MKHMYANVCEFQKHQCSYLYINNNYKMLRIHSPVREREHMTMRFGMLSPS